MNYYKNGNALLQTKTPLEELNGYVEITETEYYEIRALKAANRSSKQPSEKAIKLERIAQLKRFLAESDYQAIKYAEGWLTEEEYAPIRIQRQNWRNEINVLENELEEDAEPAAIDEPEDYVEPEENNG